MNSPSGWDENFLRLWPTSTPPSRLSPGIWQGHRTCRSQRPGLSQDREANTEPIAIIGIGCRFPGANDPAAFWQLLRDGVDAIREVPADRFDQHAFYDPDPATPGKMNTRWGGFLEQVDQFDAQFLWHLAAGGVRAWIPSNASCWR